MGSLVAELAEKLSSATNNFDIDEGTIYVNTSADTVGIGTTSPGSKFDVQGTMQVGVNDTGHDVKFFGATAGAYLEWDESADELELRGGAATPGKLLLSTAETTVVDGNKLGQIDFQAPLDSAGTDAILVGASIYAEADATFSASVNATELVFATGASETATEKVRIDSVGRVGIGTTAPDVNALLHIKTSLDSVNLLVESTEAGASISGFGINMYRNSSSPADNDNIAALRYIGRNDNSQDVTYGAMYGQIIDASDGTEDGALHIQTMKAGSLTTTMSAISGQVGIGTTAPDTNLSVTDGGTDTQTLVDISVFNDQTGYSPDLIFRKSHNDTIGTKTATTDNTILGRIIFNGVDSGTNFDWGAYIQATQDGTASGQIPAELSFYTSDGTSIAERMIIKKDGNVGIGTTSPYSLFHVHGKAFGTFGIGECIFAKQFTHTYTSNMNQSLGINYSEISQAGTIFHFRFYGAMETLVDMISFTEIACVYRNDAFGLTRVILNEKSAVSSDSAAAIGVHYDINNPGTGASGTAITVTSSADSGTDSGNTYDLATYVTIHRVDVRNSGATFRQS
tara:strand:- start:55 stop:1761 length:1707 start_codon:yes stop_codon:yes gene_type:complete